MESEQLNDLTEQLNDLTEKCEYEYIEKDTDTILIDLVKNFPQLYDKSQADFKNIHKKDRAWMKISSVLKLPGNFLDCFLLTYPNFSYIYLSLICVSRMRDATLVIIQMMLWQTVFRINKEL